MSAPEVIGYVIVGLGLIAGAFLFARRPEFWIEFGYRLFQRLWPFVWAFVSKRMSPEDEKAMRDCARRGGEWDNFAKKCRNKR